MPLKRLLDADSDTLVIAFTGFSHKLSMPPSQFFQETGLEKHMRVIVIDTTRHMCLNGVSPKVSTFDALHDELRHIIDQQTPERIITTGTSAGGFPALLFGHLLRVNHVVAFSPFTFINRENYIKYGRPIDRATAELEENFKKIPEHVYAYHDLGQVLSSSNGVTNYDIHVSRRNEWDCIRAYHMEGCPNVKIQPHPYRVHATARALQKDGKLKDCFNFLDA